MNKIILFITFLYAFSNTNAQVKDCYPDCIVDKQAILNARNPLWTRVKISKECARKIKDQRQQWLDDDQREWPRLRNIACSYQHGWIEINEGECQAGGPPPCCPVEHWYKDGQAWARFEAKCEQLKQDRWRKLEKIYNECNVEDKNPVIN